MPTMQRAREIQNRMKPPTEHEQTDWGDDYPPPSRHHERQMERVTGIVASVILETL
jgi:hypothetical protein